MTAPVALVTGGQQGIGLGIAEALARAGFRVAIASRSDPEAGSVQEALRRLGPGARFLRHDLAEIGTVPALFDRVETEMGAPVCTLVQNAGIGAPVRGDLLDLRPENFDLVLDVNLRGAFFLAQEAARRMVLQPPEPYRSIILVTSVSAVMASPERAEYCISKAGAAMAAQVLALRLAPEGIGVFELRPGIIATAMTEGVRDRYDARIAQGLVPMGRWGQPADIGSVVVPLARGDFAFATGAAIPVDGGLSVPRL